MQDVVCALLIAYILILFGRMIISWLPPTGGASATVARLLYDLTEPVLAPVRRIIPPVGMFDLSFTVVVIALLLVYNTVCS